MKEEAKRTLMKDVIFAAVAFVVALVIMIVAIKGFDITLLLGALAFAGIPFGWRWFSTIITAIGIWGLLIKFFCALILGWLALPVTIVKDVIAYKNA